ncbi:MAG: 4Fe-4S binding protein [Marinilabiliaceae bacterium]|jgi:polyferredoxin|nr:4Fe-4S binding protein [Marinilabiliaceae bacterium]
MSNSVLKRTRQILASIFFLILVLSFLDFRQVIPDSWFSLILFLQFTPSVLNFMQSPTVLAGGFIIVLALTVFTGRTYCSVICPLGTYQDLVNRLGGKIKRRNRRFAYGRAHNILRYSILAFTLILMLAGSVFLISLLDPYSVFGRFVSYFFKPVLVTANNLVAWIGAKFDYYGIFKVAYTKIPPVSYILPLVFFALVGIMAFGNGRLYCNTVCPVGTLLGIISKVSLLRISIDSENCTHCGRCSVNCKASCIDFINEEIDVSRCVSCFNCIDACQDNAMLYSYSNPARKSPADEVNSKRRRFIGSGLSLMIAALGTARAQKVPVPKKESTVREDKKYPVCPYGAISLEHFNSYCTACSLCVSACPEHVIVPSVIEYGLAGIMQPRMDYHKSFCNFDCIRCTEVCPTGALLPLSVEAKKLTQIGKVNFIKENCIVETEGTDCGACSEHCPTKAVTMVPYRDKLVIPEVNNEICVGCGACEFACPTKPYKAIFVDGNPVHLDAKKPEEKKVEAGELEDFPF